MPFLNVVQRSYNAMRELVEIPESQTDSAKLGSVMYQDFLGLNYVITKEDTLESFVKDYLEIPPSSYLQGDMTGEIFTKSLLTSLFQETPEYLSKTNQIRLSFAYYDDANILCGFSLICSTLDPKIWTAAIIHNTMAREEDCKVDFICSEAVGPIKKILPDEQPQEEDRKVDFIDSEVIKPSAQTFSTRVGEITSQLEAILNSKKIKKMIDGIILPDGTLDLDQLNYALGETHSISKFELPPEKMPPIEELKANFKKADMAIATIQDSYHTVEQARDKFKTEKYQAQQEKNTALGKLNAAYPNFAQYEKQSFLRNNVRSLTLGVAGALMIIGSLLTLTGLLAPIGIPLLAAGIAGLAIGGIVLAVSASKIGHNQEELKQYNNEKKKIEGSYEGKLKEANNALNQAKVRYDQEYENKIETRDYSSSKLQVLSAWERSTAPVEQVLQNAPKPRVLTQPVSSKSSEDSEDDETPRAGP